MIERKRSGWDASTARWYRIGEPEEVSGAVLFLASDDSSFSSGAEFIVDGGETAGLVSETPIRQR